MARSVHGLSVITDGSKGCYVGDGSYMYHAGIFPERELIDRTGAGDAFGSGFVSALIGKDSFSSQVIEQAIRAGSANATSVVEYIGAWEGLLTARTLKQNKRWAHLVVRKVLL
jgi:ribokinase